VKEDVGNNDSDGMTSEGEIRSATKPARSPIPTGWLNEGKKKIKKSNTWRFSCCQCFLFFRSWMTYDFERETVLIQPGKIDSGDIIFYHY